MPKLNKEQTSRISLMDLKSRRDANSNLLSLYSSPFPDGWERAKRAELIADINECDRQIDKLE